MVHGAYHQPDPTPSPARKITPSNQTASLVPSENAPSETENVHTGQKTPENTVFKRHTILIPSKTSKKSPELGKFWQQIEKDLPKELLKFCKEITENIVTYDQLVNFAVKCDIPLSWLERAKENYPQDSEVVVNKVFHEWWDRCNLNVGKKIQMIQAAFIYIGKPNIFNRILYKCPDLEILFGHAMSNMLPALTGGDGIINRNKTYVLEDAQALGHECIRTGKITTVHHQLIKTLSSIIRTKGDYVTICDSLGVLLEYGPLAILKYRTWMSKTEVTLIKFYSCYTSYLFRMARIRTSFNACGFLMYCDVTLVSLGHRTSAINDYACVDDPPNENSSVEDSDDESEQPQSVVVSTSNAQNNDPSPPHESETGTQNLTPVIEYEDTHNQIERTDQNIQGIVFLGMERNEVKGETR